MITCTKRHDDDFYVDDDDEIGGARLDIKSSESEIDLRFIKGKRRNEITYTAREKRATTKLAMLKDIGRREKNSYTMQHVEER